MSAQLQAVVTADFVRRSLAKISSTFLGYLRGGGLASALAAVACTSTLLASIVTRSQEPLVLSGASFPAWAGQPVDRIAVYRYDGSNWIEVPSQVDEREAKKLKSYYQQACVPPFSDPCEYLYITSGVESGNGAGLDSDDELVFLPRDGDGACYGTPPWLGVPGTDTDSTRYRIKVLDPTTSEAGYFFVYLWKSSHTPQYSTDNVEAQSLTSNETCLTSQDPACGWLLPTSSLTLNRLSVAFTGNWSVPRLCLNPDRSKGYCKDSSNFDVNVVDRIKWRGDSVINETEADWDSACRVFLGKKDGPVRIVRQIMGAQSGRYTTKFDFFYGTWFEQLVNLRAHPVDAIRAMIDHRSIQVPPQAETPPLRSLRLTPRLPAT